MDKRTKSLPGIILTQVLVFLFFVGVPALVTAIAPVSWVQFQRNGENVTARARTCLLFVIPYGTVAVDPVTRVSNRTISGSVTVKRRAGRDDRRRSESQGFLVIEGPAQTAEVSVTPFNLKSVLERSQAFLSDPQSTELKLFVVANWKFSVIGGGLVSLLTLLYVGGLLFGLVRGLVRLLSRGRAVVPA